MLKHFINKFMEKHTDTFISMKENIPLCSLSAFDTNNWNPDYSNELHREFYYLKYALAYMVEYYLSYKAIFSKDWLNEEENVNALSIGCGAMLDLVGLKFALDNSECRHMTPSYIGVDKVNWQCQETQIIPQCSYIIDDIENYRLSSASQPVNIIAFPKSISDISNDKIKRFVLALEEGDLSHKLCVINAKRGKSNTDIVDANIFCTSLARKFGYKIKEHKLIQGIEGVYFERLFTPPLKFMPNIIEELKRAAYLCSACNCDSSAYCSDIVGRSPMRYSHHMNTDIYYLEKSA